MFNTVIKIIAVVLTVVLIMTDPLGCITASAQTVGQQNKIPQDSSDIVHSITQTDTSSNWRSPKDTIGGVSTTKDTIRDVSKSVEKNTGDTVIVKQVTTQENDEKVGTVRAIVAVVLVVAAVCWTVFFIALSTLSGPGD